MRCLACKLQFSRFTPGCLNQQNLQSISLFELKLLKAFLTVFGNLSFCDGARTRAGSWSPTSDVSAHSCRDRRMTPHAKSPEWGSRSRRKRYAGIGKVAGRLIKPAPLPAMQNHFCSA